MWYNTPLVATTWLVGRLRGHELGLIGEVATTRRETRRTRYNVRRGCNIEAKAYRLQQFILL